MRVSSRHHYNLSPSAYARMRALLSLSDIDEAVKMGVRGRPEVSSPASLH